MAARPRARPGIDESKIIEHKQADIEWIKSLYDINLISDSELTSMYDAFKYQGFNRDEMLLELERITKDPKVAVQLVILCAMRGPIAAADTKLMNGLTPKQMGIPGSGQMKTKNLSCARISASTADLAAFYLKRLNIPKRILSSPLPGWLQFPTAGSIKLPEDLRQHHIEFSKRFSEMIGGKFREEIYSQMMANAYLDVNLHLFS
jgi:hypothetical protein